MSVVSYKCPNCGGELKFDPKSQKYKCEYCMSDFEQKEVDHAETKTEDTKQTGEQNGEDGAVLYSCPSCGAEIVTDSTTAATFCYYCHNPVVLSGRLSGEFSPDRIIPFQVDKKEAEQEFLSYMNKKKFVPKAFFCKKQIEMLAGVYFPYWKYDCELSTTLDGEATRVRMYQMGDVEFTETQFFEVQRGGQVRFADLLQNALRKSNRQLVEGVQPFRMEESKEFSMGYLSGFQAEKRDMERNELEESVRKEVEDYSQKLLKNSVEGYASVNVHSFTAREDREIWKYMLLPVWVLTYKGRDGELYYYAMNGQTKNICGRLPVDYMKIAGLFGIVFLPVFLFLLLGGYFLW